MNFFYLGLLFLLGFGCFPPMHTGPDPHSIEFEKEKFDEIRIYLSTYIEKDYVLVGKPPSTLPINIINKMEKIGFLDYNRFNKNYEIFDCGCGVIDQGCWGFIYGKFQDIESPLSIESEKKILLISYLENIEGNWFRYAGEIDNGVANTK